ncbi:MAG TPA: FecR family protein [Verrucomicrobiae bacterium]|nr:FecR family protein [Verrucomicrobiae bacterium]
MLRPFSPTLAIRTLLVAATVGVCLHAAPPAACPGLGKAVEKEPGLGTAVVVAESGSVSVMRGNAVALFEGSLVKRQEKIVTGHDGYAKFVVAGCSVFEVYPDSQVIFHDNPTVTYKNLLEVFIGRIKVFIEHLNGPNYNQVTTPTAVISVRGTVFDVVVEDNDGTTLVSVDDGLVQVQNRTAPGNEPTLKPGDWIRVFKHQPLHGQLINHNDIAHRALQVATDTFRVLLGHGSGGVPIGGAGGGTGAQGDKGKNTGGSGTGSSTGSTGPPTGPKPGGGG